MRYKLVIWGIGAVYNKHVNLLKYYEFKNEIEIVAITSSNSPCVEKIDDYELIRPNELCHLDFDFILIMSDTAVTDIREIIKKIGIKAEKILSYKVLEIPNLVFEQYVELKNSRVSIISNNCWGGIVYNILNMECLSPFKNLFLEDDSYLHMLNNLEYYLKCEPVAGGFATDVHSGKRYPTLKLDDVMVHCNHDDDYETAVENWKKRVKKLNWNNLFVEMYTSDRQIAERFIQLKRYQNKICFVPFASEEKELCHLELLSGQVELWEAVNSSAKQGKSGIAYNIIELLRGKNYHRCK